MVWQGALAQGLGNNPLGMGASRLPRGQAQSEAKEPLPDAVPGAKPREPAAPATRSSYDMDPNAALFDAINRGDIVAARDALNRGADLHATDILGMTPIELSVDLGRNDITFLLLSMRGADSGSTGSRTAARATPPEKVAHVAEAKTPAHSHRAAARPAKVAVEKPVGHPKLWADDGGTPKPSAGFLGFGMNQAAD